MLIRWVLSSKHTCSLLLPNKSGLQPIGPSSRTRHGWFSLSAIDQYSSLLPPVGVWTVSQFQCGGPSSQNPSNVGDLPLRTPTHRRFGGPLPRQLPNGTRANPIPINLLNKNHAVSVVTEYYATFPSTILQYRACCSRVTHPFAGRRHCIATTRCPSTCMC